MVHGVRCPRDLVRLLVTLEIVCVTRHDDFYLVFPKELMDGRKGCHLRSQTLAEYFKLVVLCHPFSREGLVVPALVTAAGIERMAQNGHREFPPRTLQCGFQPGPLVGVHSPKNPGIDGDQGKSLRLHLEKWAPLPTGTHAIFLT